jgi:hypothetical protein
MPPAADELNEDDVLPGMGTEEDDADDFEEGREPVT